MQLKPMFMPTPMPLNGITKAAFLVVASLSMAGGAAQELAEPAANIAANARTSENIAITEIKAGEAVSVPATGTQQLSFTAPQFGRYALQASSKQGSALQLIDRENGPGNWHGAAGQSNGRLDAFLEAGDYRLRVHSSERGSGMANVQLQAFKELQPEALQLVELKPENTTLADFEQRSWWLELDRPRRIVIEAGGRHLQSLELWRDGRWRIPLKVAAETITPEPGKPLKRLSFSVQLEPGQYRLSAYGGIGQTWAETSGDAPLYLRWGVPPLPAANRQQFEASPLGIDRYRVPDTADYFRLELSEPMAGAHSSTSAATSAATLAVGNWFLDDPFNEDSRDSITKKSRLPVATLNLNSRTPVDEEADAGLRLVTVHAPAGQTYTLQHFTRSSNYRINQSGNWWLDSIHAGAAEDTIDATALLVAVKTDHSSGGSSGHSYGRNLSRIVATTEVTVDQNQGWNRRFNLLQPAELFLQIVNDGDYEFAQLGRKADPEIGGHQQPKGFANLTLEPVYLNRPKNAPQPIELEPGAAETLSAGLYRLRLEPRRKGIVEVAIFAAGTTVPAETPVQGSNRFGSVELEPGWQHIVIPANQGGIDSGLILRRLPLDMSQPLSITLAANEKLSLPLSLPTAGLITAVDEHGNPPELYGRWLRKGLGKLLQPAGSRKLTISNTANSNTANRPAVISLNWQDPALRADSPLPKAAAVKPAGLPKLVSGSPQFLDLASNTSQTFELRVDKPALYRIESTGLLATAGQLRTGVTPDLATAERNGVGRNFLIQRYLRPGGYRLTVGTQGASAGRLGVSLSAAPLTDAGELVAGTVSRQLLPAGQGLDQRFNVTAAGQYELQVLSQLRQLRFRLEDSGGWPVLPPGKNSPLQLPLAADRYRLIIEPGAVDGRVITRLTAQAKPPKFKGHGPHRVTLNQRVKNRWMEPATGEQRQPDQWFFNLTAAATISINASNEMRGVLYRLPTAAEQSATKERITEVLSPAGWQGELAAGNYRLELEHGRRSNRVDYQIRVSSRQLLPGQSRTITAPASLPLSLPAGLSRIASFGPADVRARLYDSRGTAVASNDDASGDWNFLIGASLPVGQYRLEVEPVGAKRARPGISTEISTEISLEAPETRLLPAQRLAAEQLHEQTLDLQAQYTLPLEIAGSNGQLLLIRADTDDTSTANINTANGDIGLSFEQCTLSSDDSLSGDVQPICKQLSHHSGQPAWLAIALDSKPLAAAEAPEAPQELAARKTSYRLRVWSQNGQAVARPVRVRLLQTEPKIISEQPLANGLALPAATRSITHTITNAATSAATSDGMQGWSAARLILSEAAVFAGETSGLRFAAANKPGNRGLQASALRGQLVAAKQTLVAGLSGTRLQATRQLLSPGKSLSLPLRSGDVATLNTATSTNPTLVIARAHNGQPGIAAVGSAADSVPGSALAADRGFSEGAAVTVIHASTNTVEQNALRVWRADAEYGDGIGNGEGNALALQLQRFALSPIQTLIPDEQGRIVLPPRSAVAVALPTGRKNLQLALPSETVAVLKNEITLWSDANSSSDTLNSNADELHIYHAGTQPALFSLQQSVRTGNGTDTSTGTSELSTTSPLWQTSLTSRSRLHIRVNSTGNVPTQLEFGGNIQAATWSGNDGRQVRIDNNAWSVPDITAGGILSIDAQPGRLAVWLDGPDVSAFTAADSKPVRIPGTVSVLGAKTFSFSTTEPQLLSVRGHAPALLQLQSNGNKPSRTLQASGTRLNQYLPIGDHKLAVRLLGLPELPEQRKQQTIDSLTLATRGVIEINAEPPKASSTSTAANKTLASKASPLRLAAGDSVLYRFSIESDRKVGIGINASPDQTEAQLMDANGKLIGRGSTQLQSLTAGHYLLQVSAPANGESLEITALIIGLQEQDDGPPAELRNQYIQQARAAAEGSR